MSMSLLPLSLTKTSWPPPESRTASHERLSGPPLTYGALQALTKRALAVPLSLTKTSWPPSASRTASTFSTFAALKGAFIGTGAGFCLHT